MTDEKRPAHRPANYYPEICQELIDYYDNSDNPTIIEFCKIHNIKRSTFYDWVDMYTELSDTKKRMQQIEAFNFNERLQELIVTYGNVKVNSTPLVMRARSLGIKTRDDADTTATDRLADALKAVVTTYALPDNGRLKPDNNDN